MKILEKSYIYLGIHENDDTIQGFEEIGGDSKAKKNFKLLE